VMACESPKLEGEPGTRLIVRQLLTRATGCLVAGLLLVAYLSPSLPLFQLNLTRSDSRKLRSFNVSEQPVQLYNASNKQLVGPGSGTGVGAPGGPNSPLCVNPEEVTHFMVCNYGATRILPHISSWAPSGRPGRYVYWGTGGDWIAAQQCYTFDTQIPSSHDNLPIDCVYRRESENLPWPWHPCAGGTFRYKRESQCVGKYICSGNPVVCTKAAFSFIIPGAPQWNGVGR